MALALTLTALAAAGCGGGSEGSGGPARGEVVKEELFGYELRLPGGWRSLGRADKQSNLKFGGDGKGCELAGGAPPPPIDDADALLRQSERNFELHAEPTPGARVEFKPIEVPDALGVESRLIGPGDKRHVNARIVSASTAILIDCATDADREPELRDQLEQIYASVRMQTSPLAEKLQPQVARLPSVTAAWAIEDPGQIAAQMEADDMRRGQRSAIDAARLLHRAAPDMRVAVVVENPDDPGPVIQAQIELGSDTINLQAPGGNRRIPLKG